MQTRALVEAAMLITIFVVFTLIAFYLPFGVIVTLVLALPHALISYRHGWRMGVLALIAATILVFLILDPLSAISAVGLFATVGVIIGHGARVWSSGRTLLWSSMVASVVYILLILLVSQVMGFDMYAQMLGFYEEALEQAAQSYSDMGVGELNTDSVVKAIQEMATTLKPAILLLLGFMPAYVSYRMFMILGKRLKIKIPPVPLMHEWSFPAWTGILYVIGNVLQLVLKDQAMVQMVAKNLSFIFVWPVLGQGISLIVLFLRKYFPSKLFFFFVLFMLLTSPLLSNMLILLGLFDMFFNYRGWVKERRSQE